ncbi:GNAT family N-acetyltransferase [Streptantibioticus rubrisoli]|uniref:GNAT family N-acetyltransferase n=1 Tax=Streptantibioticus rubrisoli TaxID=1387313 RepID=A0ABT1P6W4_9ACTN|nr:GNAT family N-acetyltransferase [Streptantibioticus rubrisoli]MCQ4041112.1 GNAT family N-acetyltransferase [Streptantibioticus rubrisoli]
MTFATAPMTAEHIPESAALLDRWYTRSRRPRGYPAPENPYGIEELLVKLLAAPGAQAVVARGGRGRLGGYLVVAPDQPGGDERPDEHRDPRSALVAHGGHALQPGREQEALRALYAAVAERFVADGRLVHHVDLPADDTVASAWFRLGFGLERMRGLLPVRASGRQPRGVDGLSIRRASGADLGPIGRMAVESAEHRRHAAVFQPQSPEALDRLRTRYADALTASDSAAWLAVRRGEEAGMVVLTPAQPGPFTPQSAVELAEAYVEPDARGEGVSRVLLATALAWAYDRGYRHMAANWPTASPLAAGHWPAFGFTPVAYRLCRVIDSRMAPGG